jgi:hypothetical protein
MFCMKELSTALHHHTVVLRKKRLIVLMLLDDPLTTISDTLNRDEGTAADFGLESLRQYLRQYTYIDYKADDWFNRLLYALPVNGIAQQQQQQSLQNQQAEASSFISDDDDDCALLQAT